MKDSWTWTARYPKAIEEVRDMKVLIITANPRNSGSLASLTSEAARGASVAGAQVEEIRLADMDIAYCRFCLKCHDDVDSDIAYCVQKDDLNGLLDKVREADAFVLACPMSGGHASAIMKTFIERTTWTLGRPTRQMLWIKGIPESRITERERRAVTITTTGVIPAWSRALCDGSTREMSAMAKGIFNAKILGSLYAGNIFKHGVTRRQLRKAYDLGRTLQDAPAD